MRILLLFVALLLVTVSFVFGFSNPTVVVVDLFGTPIESHVGTVGVVALAVGAVLISIVAVIEGGSMRFENRRLRRDIRRLETEINFLRTQPAPDGPRREPDALDGQPASAAGRPGGTAAAPPSAPVYDVGHRVEHDDDEDDAYTGGSAV